MEKRNLGLLTLYLVDSLQHAEDVFFEKDPTQDEYERFAKSMRFARMCLDLIEDGEDEFSWVKLAEHGNLCERDFTWFEKSIKEANIGTYEEYSKRYSETHK